MGPYGLKCKKPGDSSGLLVSPMMIAVVAMMTVGTTVIGIRPGHVVAIRTIVVSVRTVSAVGCARSKSARGEAKDDAGCPSTVLPAAGLRWGGG